MADHFAPGERIAVLLPLPLAGTYDYRVPDGMTAAAGDIVEAPLGSRVATGVVWGPGADSVAEMRIRDVIRVRDVPPLSGDLRRLVDWVARYTVHPPGAVLRMVLSVPEALDPEGHVTTLAPGEESTAIRLTPARRRVLAAVERLREPTARELAAEAGVGPSVIDGLVRAGALRTGRRPAPPPPTPAWCRPGPALSPDQSAAAELLRRAVGGGFTATVLDGVTGSGKTEVYFEGIAEALRQGRQVLVLLPEIALGAQWFQRFRERFGVAPSPWHSDLTRAQRRRVWRRVADGTVSVVVGARSALFLPFRALGLIIVDEEHDPSFKQEEGVVYNARDMAVVRARLAAVPVVLVSATPSLETMVNVRQGRYRCVRLPERYGGARLPAVTAVDLRADPPPRGSWLSPPLMEALTATLAGGTQALLFLNRRGYAPLTVCRACGHRLRCPNCTAWLVEHRAAVRLQCHHCGYHAPVPSHCPACNAADSLVACGPGVERIATEVRARFPEARLAVAASDTLTGPAAAAELVRRIEQRELDVIIGTQVLAKGYHFPLLTLVGVIDGDLGLSGGDLRASERTFQLLHQVAGRAGRAKGAGRVLVQTHMPEHPVMAAVTAADRDRFLEAEAASRQEAGMPPFGRLAALIVSCRDEGAADAAAAAFARTAPDDPRVRVLGPAPAPLALLRGRHRRRLLLIADRGADVSGAVRSWLTATPVAREVRIQVDIDPYSFL
ncbi:MAG: primosomal protein N' [Rhodospirillales bacterium]|nr:MAG: primosomal protein N' [Rhodospirillales bacterium]